MAAVIRTGSPYGERGFPVTEMIAEQWGVPSTLKTLRTYPESTRVFLPNDKAPMEGDLFRNPDLGRAYRILAEEGPQSFYEGRIAEAMLSAMRDFGGLMTEKT